jgi:murein DD-endopeptidase MepM/ murein hydrolase activator NlpD
MNSRYIGSDDAIQRQQEAITNASQSTLAATDRIGKSVQAGIGAVVQGQQNLSELEMQRQQALARNTQGSGIAVFADAAGKALDAYTTVQANERIAKAKIEANKAEVQAEVQAGAAAEEIATLQQTYIRDNWSQGVLNFRNQASKIIAKYPGLSPKQINDLIGKANEVATTVTTDVIKKENEEVEKLQMTRAATTGKTFLIGLQGDVEYLRRLSPTTQAKPFLDQLQGKLENFLRTDNGLTETQKYEFLGQALDNIRGAYADKAGAFAEFDANIRAFDQWKQVGSAAYNNFTTGKITYAQYKAEMAALKITTNKDFSTALVAPGEQEANTAALVNNLTAVTRVQEEAQKKAATNANLGDDVVNGIAAGLVVSPGLETNLLANPLLANNPNIQQAVAISKRIREANNDAAQLGIDQADVQKTIAELDLTDVRAVTALTRTIVNKTSNNQTLNAKEQLTLLALQELARVNPEAAAKLQQLQASAGGNGEFTAADMTQLQQTLKLESGSLARIKQEAINVYTKKVDAHNTKYSDLIQRFGKIPTNSELAEFYKQANPRIEQRIQEIQATVEQAGQNAVSPYGQQADFSTAGGNMAVSRQPDGRYTVAPRTALQVQTRNLVDGGAPFITPMMAGDGGLHSFNKGEMGGGYGAGRSGGKRKHAGIDFPLGAGQKSMSIVSGTVINVGNDSSGYGGYVDFQGDNGYVYRYAHLRAFVKKGQRLGAGEAIGTPNGSGAGGHHLHFEVRDGAAYAKGQVYGIEGTVDPVTHLRQLTKLAGTSVGSNAGKVRGQSTQAVREFMPQAKANNNSIFTPAGGVLQANLFQQVGRPAQPASQVFTAQRPLTMASGSNYVVGSPSYNLNDDLGYAYLRNNPDVRIAMHRAAKELGVPTAWIADIAAQETGNFVLATKTHPGAKNRNYGLFGFGVDSGVPNFNRLTPVQQVNAYVTYMNKAGWLKAKGSNATLAQFWAVTRMGTDWRNQILRGRDPQSLKLNDSGKTYADELRLLGNHVGREYDVPGGRRSGRAKRNSAVRKRADTSLGQAIALNNSYEVNTREG